MSFEDILWSAFGAVVRVAGIFGRVAVWAWWWGSRPVTPTRQTRPRGPLSHGYRLVWRVGQVLGWAICLPVALVALKVEYF